MAFGKLYLIPFVYIVTYFRHRALLGLRSFCRVVAINCQTPSLWPQCIHTEELAFPFPAPVVKVRLAGSGAITKEGLEDSSTSRTERNARFLKNRCFGGFRKQKISIDRTCGASDPDPIPTPGTPLSFPAPLRSDMPPSELRMRRPRRHSPLFPNENKLSWIAEAMAEQVRGKKYY